MRRLGSIAVGALVCLSTLLAFVPAAVAVEDTTAPVVVWLTSSHTTVDTIDGPVEVTLRARVTDDESGVVPSGMRFGIGYGSSYSPFIASSPQLVSGDARDGVYQVRLTVPEYANNGTWQTALVDITDVAGNKNQGMFGPTLQVTSTEDSTPPAMDSDAPNSVDVTDGEAEAVVTVTASDMQSGFESWAAPSLRLSQGNGSAYSFIAMTRVSGDAHRATYRSALRFSSVGSYLVTIDGLRDVVGNEALPHYLTVTVGTRPQRPKMPTVTGPTTAPIVGWETPGGGGLPITGYEVRAFNATTAVTLTAPQSQRHLQELATGTYAIEVRAKNDLGWGPWSTTLDGVVVTALPDAPAGLWAQGGAQSAQLSWPAASGKGSPVASYTLRDLSSGAARTVPGTQTTFTWDGLVPGERTFSVVATNAYGSSPSQRSAPVTVSPVPHVVPATTAPVPALAAPGKMNAPRVMVRGSSAVVKWVAPKANGSRIRHYLVDIAKGKDKRVAGTGRKAIFKHLKPGVYRFRVAARNAVGWSPVSSWVKVRIK